jgi:hypothetical protein
LSRIVNGHFVFGHADCLWNADRPEDQSGPASRARFYLPPEQSDAARIAGATVDPALPKNIEELQNQINAWWRNNKTKTLLDRKIEDVNDPIHENRFSAYGWLGRTKAEAGRLPWSEG